MSTRAGVKPRLAPEIHAPDAQRLRYARAHVSPARRQLDSGS